MSIREAAGALDVAPMTFLRWELGTSTPRRANAIAYARFLTTLKQALRS
ncbi:MAG: hypothetical protein M3P70_01500 [Actinomycetota bacterium]|nr:hypothetical protein [Actinomycetota bacterium]